MRRPRRSFQPPRDDNEPRINDRIRVPRVLVIDEEGRKLGEFLTADAVTLARERGLDLVEVAPNGRPPVCKITDFGKLKYDKKKRETAAKKNQHLVQIKEVKVRPKTDEHDMNVKIKRANQFLASGNKVKVTVRFRGREHAHRDIGADQCLRVAEEVKENGLIEAPPRMEGRQMFMILAPLRRPSPAQRQAILDEMDEEEEEDDDDDDDLDEDEGEGEGEEEPEAEATGK